MNACFKPILGMYAYGAIGDQRSSFFFFQAEDGIRDAQESRGLGDVYKRQEHLLNLSLTCVVQAVKSLQTDPIWHDLVLVVLQQRGAFCVGLSCSNYLVNRIEDGLCIKAIIYPLNRVFQDTWDS